MKILNKYLYVYVMFFCWALYDGLSLRFGTSYPTNSIWHVSVLVFIFVSIWRMIPSGYKAIDISFCSFLVVILLKICLNLIASFAESAREYDTILNNFYVDLTVLVLISIVHVVIGVKWRT